MYLEPWHADVFEFLDLKKNHGKEEMRARDLFYALWTPDLFMQRVEQNGDWTLMCPHECPGLDTSWGPEFEKLYTKYEREGRGRRTIKAQELWFAILESQTETGTPYMLYKDAANGKSNQQNLGTIKSSNLCTEIMEYTDKDEIAVCNLASLALPRYLVTDAQGNTTFDHQKLYEVTYQTTINLNRVIDVNYYPVPETERSNKRHRPIGLGVQGLADTFIHLRMPFESDEAAGLNKDIFETIYFAAMTASKDLAIKDGAYETFAGSPLSQGKFQFDLWGVTPESGRWDWDSLRAEVMQHGVRNSLLVAPMPTASTAQVLGNNESFEPYTSNIYVRRVLSGEFMVVNKHLLHDLVALGLWNEQMKQEIIAANGSVQGIARIPQHIKDLYKTRVFTTCRWRNANHRPWMKGPAGEVIPTAIIEKPPSAELRPDQKDEDSLPPYPVLDSILTGLIERDRSVADLVAEGHDRDTVKKVERLIYISEWKRYQAAPGPRISTKAFWLDRRYPLVNRWRDRI